MMENKLRVLYVSAEIAPFGTTGGLGDVGECLPEVIANNGLNMIRVMPKYKGLEEKYGLNEVGSFIVETLDKANEAKIYKYEEKSLTTYFIGSREYFERDNLYGYDDEDIRFGFFSKAVLEMLIVLNIKPNIIHVNDWHSGLIPFLLKNEYSHITFYNNIKTVYTIHNLQYQGVFGSDSLDRIGLSHKYYDSNKLEYYGNISFMKGGIIYSDIVTTVSDNYAKEIQTPQYGYGLDGILRQYKSKIYGIINGIDYEKFNCETDEYVYRNYNKDNVLMIKYENKHFLQQKIGLPVKKVPLIGMVSRLSEQKGINLCLKAIEELISEDLQFVILGTGDKKYEQALMDLSNKHPDKVAIIIDFNQKMARLIYSGCDFFLMPSLFEPCGLSQIYSMRFGTVPIVRKTGGLADTVIPFGSNKGTGFLFDRYDVNEFIEAINEGLETYGNKDRWRCIVGNCMNQRFSWDNSAKKYIEKYNQLIKIKD
ncbi:glycogen synthase [Vallitalea sp.]|jgi:starch synthase|uniref:glycogen synthase n=1 Tax=Vallitalea sp. TaxID=1882829 RepID=UPI0025CE05A9|nr:glycogen/starch synthase [Vallitalea sp.]MCT4685770.1 glycogen synthase [Vallitalea sp.]